MLTGYLRKGQNRPALTARTLLRQEQRAQARAEQRLGRPVIGHQDRAIVAARNAGLMTAGEYLRGIGFPEAERYASAFGRAVAKQYRATHNTEPFKGCIAVVRGRIHLVFGYVDVADLYAGAYSYARTRKFLNSQQAAAPHALAA